MIICSQQTDKRSLVEFFYKRETQYFHTSLHENGGTEDENVEDTLRTISADSVMFKIDVDGEVAAFFTRYENESGNLAMECFHVGIQFRNADFLPQFWAVVKSKFKRAFYAGLYEKNIEAVNHFKRQGFEVVDELGSHPTRILIFKIK